ncbi:MAG: hypothetical protein ACFFDT_34945, partial [Candidatus Hodarchaeota archaeon]
CYGQCGRQVGSRAFSSTKELRKKSGFLRGPKLEYYRPIQRIGGYYGKVIEIKSKDLCSANIFVLQK